MSPCQTLTVTWFDRTRIASMEHFEIDGWFISPDDTVFGTTVDLVRLGQPRCRST